MNVKFLAFFSFILFILFTIFFIKPVSALSIAKQTDEYSTPLYVWQMIQELGDNLSGIAQNFTFRVDTSRTNLNQFDYTAQNAKIYDKTTNALVVPFGCLPSGSDPNDRLRGLTFSTNGVPVGYEDVTIDFSCHNYNFVPGHRYLIFITNANMGNSGSGQILFAASAYANTNLDYFPGGGLRYANGNPYDYYHNGGRCDPVNYIWGDITPNPTTGCNILTSPKDDLYFILNNTIPEPAPTLTPTPTPTPTPLPSKTPLILIPGIGGSELKVAEDTIWNKDDGHGGVYNRAYAKDEKVWVNEGEAILPGDDDYFDILRMKIDGINPEASLETTGNLYTGAYQGAIDFFTSSGYKLNQDLFVFPYDWRLDLSETASLLDQKIQSIKQQTGTQKVDIVAHSMGGLIARNYIADSAKAVNVRKLFTLGTPHLGAVKFLKVLKYGDCLIYEIGPFCLSIVPSEIKDVARNMISGFELAPSQAYFNFYSGEDNQHPYPFRTELGPLNYNQIKNMLTTLGYNTMLFNPSEIFHLIDNNLSNTNGVDVTVIAGSGRPTLGQIIEEKTISLLGITGIRKDIVVINGDETVPLFSASLNDIVKSQSLLGSAKLYYTSQKHGDLVTSGSALNLVKNILNDDTQLPNGVSTSPYSFNGVSLSIHSPVSIHVYDNNGNHTGPTADGFEANIPGSSHDSLDDAKFVYLSDNGVYSVKFEATNQGSFDFKIRKFENDENTETILYKEIPLTNNTKAETVFDTQSTQTPIIKIDENGDGISDVEVERFSVLEGSTNYDYIPPTISFDVNPKTIWPPNNKMVGVNIIGSISDENPYLIKILIDDEYNLVEPSITIQNQLDINQTIELEAARKGNDKDGRIYTIKVLATDLAGNTSIATTQVIVPHDQGKKK